MNFWLTMTYKVTDSKDIDPFLCTICGRERQGKKKLREEERKGEGEERMVKRE